MEQHKKGLILVALPPDRISARDRERLHLTGEGREVRVTVDKAEVEPILDEIEIGMGDVPFSLIPRMPRLAWVQLWSAGADLLQKYPEVKALPFMLTSTSGIHGRQLTEHIFALLLAWTRGLHRALPAQRQHEWLRPAFGELPVLAGKAMLILGYGAIGESLAQAALAFGMEVTGVRRRVPGPGKNPAGGLGVRVEPASRLGDLLPGADVVVNLLPLTPDTARCFGSREFAAMKAGGVYINAGRGGVTDEAALIEALRAKTIAAALLDVTGEEPLPPDSPLWDMENVLLTAHYGGIRADYDRLALDIALENLARYTKGEPLRNLVDKEQGY
jgi:phosphoglycerate dehydrogenase-like enzyme